MDCTFINLDGQVARRLEFVDNFKRYAPGHWKLHRTAAVSILDVEARQVAGSISAAEKGCFLSHLSIVEAHRGRLEPLFILEDDACLGPQGVAAIDRLIRSLPDDGVGWDLIFTDVVVASAEAMVKLAGLQTARSREGQVRLINLRELLFGGSAAYIVNPRSIRKLEALLSAPAVLDRPFDLRLRDLVYSGQLTAWATFPFLTSVSRSAETSQIQRPGASNADIVWNTFRRLMWIDGHPESNRNDLDHIQREICDERSRAIGTVIAACVSSRFIAK